VHSLPSHRLTFLSVAGTDEKALVAVLCYRSNSQRQVLKTKYKAMHGKVIAFKKMNFIFALYNNVT